jgi:hypothetical protein
VCAEYYINRSRAQTDIFTHPGTVCGYQKGLIDLEIKEEKERPTTEINKPQHHAADYVTVRALILLLYIMYKTFFVCIHKCNWMQLFSAGAVLFHLYRSHLFC